MILGDSTAPHLRPCEPVTLDGLLHEAAMRHPEALALCDPCNRANFTDGAPRRLTYAQADHIVSAIAGRLRRIGLSVDAPVALQLPNTIESILTLLGIWRAGMIAVPLPLLWRRIDAVEALNRVSAKAIITCSRINSTDHGALARDIASEVFAIRYVCGFGESLPDGVISFDDLLTDAPLLDPPPAIEREGNPATHVAVVTFESTGEGAIPVARSHAELIAGGQAIRLEAQLRDGSAILASCGSSFAGLALSVVPWLLTGGTLSLHHPFDPAAFAEQCAADNCDTVVLPGPLATRVSHAGLLTHPGLRNVLALWRAPERLSIGTPWQHPQAGLIDVLAFGETGLIAGRRGAAGQPAEIPLGEVFAPRSSPDAQAVLETTVTGTGTLSMRGAMVPHHSYPPGAEHMRGRCFVTDGRGFADTFHPCRLDGNSREVVVTGPPAGIVSVGGYRFTPEALQQVVDSAVPDCLITALPDALTGHRLAGSALERTALRQTLEGMSVNPLISGAFRERRRTLAA